MKPILFDFSNPTKAEAAKKKIVDQFIKAGAEVATAELDQRESKTAGVAYRRLSIAFSDSQTVALLIKATGDVYQVLLNGKPMPLRNQADPAKAIAEVASALNAGRAAWQKKLARVRTKTETEGGRGLATRLMRKRQLVTIVAEKREVVAAKETELSGIKDQIAALSA